MVIERDKGGRPAEPENTDHEDIVQIDCRAADEMFAPYLAHDLGRMKRRIFINHIRNCCICHDSLFAMEFALRVAASGLEGDMDDEVDSGPSASS
jgi:hypothetical protein